MKRARLTNLVIIVTAAFLAFSSTSCENPRKDQGAGGYEWPRWRGPKGDGISLETGWNPKALEDGPKVLWKAEVGIGYSNVAIAGNRLYTMGSSDHTYVYCLRADNGKVIWKYVCPSQDSTQATPTIDGAYLYALVKEGVLLCLSTKNGKLKWQKDLVAEYGVVKPNYGFAGSPVVAGGLVLLTANTAGIALDKLTGDKSWCSERPPDSMRFSDSNGVEYSTPVIYEQEGKRCMIVPSYRGLYSVEIETGKPVWLYDWEEKYYLFREQIADPIIFADKLFLVGAGKDYLGSIFLDIRGPEPKVIWQSKDTYSDLASPVLMDDLLYVCQNDGLAQSGSVRCFDPKTGKLLWEEKLAERPISLAAVNRQLILLDEKGMLYIAEASANGFNIISAGDVLEGAKVPRRFWTAPVLCNGRIYCREMNAGIICIDARS